MQGFEGYKNQRLLSRLRAYTDEVIDLRIKLENPKAGRLETRKARLSRLQKVLIPNLQAEIIVSLTGKQIELF